MHWKRRRPTWPLWVALGGLFVLTLVAPWSWQHPLTVRDAFEATDDAEIAASDSPASAATRLVHFAPPEPPAPPEPTLAPTPALPPLAESAVEPPLAEPMVIADDYVAVEDPVADAAAAGLVLELADVAEQETAQPPASPVEETIALRPAARSVLKRSVAAPKPVAWQAVNVESLAKVGQAILAAVEQAREAHAAAAAPASPMRVLVESERDRLAMAAPRLTAPPEPLAVALPTLATPVPTPAAEPTLAPAPEPTPAGPPAFAVLRHQPEALVRQLESLTHGSPAQSWALEALAQIERLTAAGHLSDDEAVRAVEHLKQLADRGARAAQAAPSAESQTEWLRASRALGRRMPVWSLLAVSPREPIMSPAEQADVVALLRTLHEIAAITAGTAEGATWREYLRLDDLAGLTSVGGDGYGDARRAVAREILSKMADPWLTAPQREFLAERPFAVLAELVLPWAGGEASLDTLAAFIEHYESTGSLRDADAIAELRLRMKWSSDPRLQQLAEAIEREYRGANMRMTFSAELVNRLIPPQEPVTAPVRSRIAGADVRGRSQTETQIHVRLLPDDRVWRFGLEAHGIVNSRTYSDTWPARLRNASHMEYEARKLVLVNRFGLHVYPTEARAEGSTKLVGVDSTFSPVPIIGALVESAARQQHQQSRAQAVGQVKAKVSEEARSRMDAEADAKLANLDQRFREHVLEPLDRFALAAEPLDMNTTAERATMRLRLARQSQLAAHTPRPSAPSDSLASFQMHESVLNNGVRGLELDGRRMTVGELHAVLSEKIRRHADVEPADLPRAAKVQFAAHDAIRVSCRGDRVELILNIVELRHGRDSIRGVGVHAFFRPVVEGLEVKLVRDGSLQFDGAHLRTGPRMVLHSVFGKLLPKDQEVPVLAARLSEDQRFAGLMVTQLVIDDGWVAISLGPATPHRTAWRTRGAEAR